MELRCSPGALPTIPQRRPFTPASSLPRSISAFSSERDLSSGFKKGSRCMKAMALEETSTVVSGQLENGPNEARSKKIEEAPYEGFSTEEAPIAGDFLSNLNLKVETLLDSVKWDDKGLAVAIVQNLDTGSILMQGFANREALATTISSRKATFYSRSRSSLWTKGETSMNFINVHDIFLDCDHDSIIYLGKPDGPTCHTGSETCYYKSIFDLLEDSQTNKERLASTTLYSLEGTISQRKDEIEESQNGKPSWTKRLLLDEELLCSKIREEAVELIQSLLEKEDRSRTASEMADLLYHSMVLLRVKDVKMEEVLEILRKRFSKSGVEEKSSRKRPDNQS